METGLNLLSRYLPALAECQSVDFPEFPTLELTDEDELGRRGKIFRHESKGLGDSWLLEAAADCCRFSVNFADPRPCAVEMFRRLSSSCKIRTLRRNPVKGYQLTFLLVASDSVSPGDQLKEVKDVLSTISMLAEKVEAESQTFIRSRAQDLF